MNDEIKDGFTRLRELAENIQKSIADDKWSLANAQLKKLVTDIDLLEAEIEFSEQ